MLMGRFPDVVGANEVRAEQFFERFFIHNCAEVDHHIRAFQQRENLVVGGEIGLCIPLAGIERANVFDEIGADEFVAHRGQRLPQIGAQTARSASQHKFLQFHVIPFGFLSELNELAAHIGQ